MPTLQSVSLLCLVFALLGIGPARVFLQQRRDWVEQLALAPLFGFGLLLLVGTWLVQFDIPVSSWALPVASLGSLGSLGLAFYYRCPSASAKGLKEYGLLFLFVGALLVAPALIGGAEFTTYRGNLIDDVNYQIGARAFDLHPLSFQTKTAPETLLATDPSLLMVQRSLWAERVPVVMALAFGARVSFLPIIQAEWGFTLVFFLLALGPAVLFCREFKLPRPIVWMTCVALACGFWAQLVLDLRAMGHILNFPLTLGSLWAGMTLLRSPSWRAVFSFSLLLTGSCLAYPEMVPSLVLGLGSFLLLGLFLLRGTPSPEESGLSRRMAFLLSLLFTTLLLSTQAGFFWRFLVRQLYAATVRGGEMAWQNDWFRFLYEPNRFQGFWGLSWGRLCEPGALGSTLDVLSVALTYLSVLLLFWALLTIFKRKTYSIGALVFFALCFLVQYYAMNRLGNPWAAAKALSYGFPFLILFLVAASWSLFPSGEDDPHGTYLGQRLAYQFLVICFLLGQSAFAFYRLSAAPRGETFFVYREPMHRSGSSVAYDRELESFAPVLQGLSSATIWTLQPEIWDFQRFNLRFGHQVHFAPLLGTDHYDPQRLISKPLAATLRPASHLLVDREFFGDSLPVGMTLVQETKRSRLLRVEPAFWERPALLGIFGERTGILERREVTNCFSSSLPWALWLYSPRQIVVKLKTTAFLVATSSRAKGRQWRAEPGIELSVPLFPGLNEIILHGPRGTSLRDLSLSFEQPIQ